MAKTVLVPLVFFDLKTPINTSVDKGENLHIKFSDDSIMGLSTLSFASPSEGAGATGLFFSSAPGIQVTGTLTESQLKLLKEKTGILIRLQTTDGNKEASIKSKRASYLQNLAQLIPETIPSKDIKGPKRNLTSDAPFEFRGLKWGNSTEEIKKSFEGNPVFEEGDKLAYQDEIGNLKTLLLFHTGKEGLERIIYSFQDEHSEDNLYILDYAYIKKLLEEKYGEGMNDTEWLNTLYANANNEEDYGKAIAAGHMRLRTKWTLRDATIILGLIGDNYEISHILSYEPYPQKVKNKVNLGKL